MLFGTLHSTDEQSSISLLSSFKTLENKKKTTHLEIFQIKLTYKENYSFE